MIKIEGLTKVYKYSFSNGHSHITANKDISFKVDAGEFFGILGPNGAGKSTLIRQIAGLLKPSAGTLRVYGIDVTNKPERIRTIIGYMPQGSFALLDLTVTEALIYTARLRGLTRIEARLQCQEILQALDIKTYQDCLIMNLSGGVRRFVTCAIALIGRPQLLIFDEPTNELDPTKRLLILNYINTLRSAVNSRHEMTHATSCLL